VAPAITTGPTAPLAMPKVGAAPEPELVAEKLPVVAENLSNATVSSSIGPDPTVSVGGEWTSGASGMKLAGTTSAGRECCGTGPSGSTNWIGCGAGPLSPGGVLEPCAPCSFA
jgi:hypothetical protein